MTMKKLFKKRDKEEEEKGEDPKEERAESRKAEAAEEKAGGKGEPSDRKKRYPVPALKR